MDPRAGGNGHSLRERAVIAVALAFVLLTVATSPTHATPSFARKYQTSCQTCHIAYPKLNSFGQSFRLLGYHLPAETEDQVKTPDVSLGSEGYKKMWPKSAVWPGAIPSHVPIAVVAEFQVVNSSVIEDGDRETVHSDFVFPSALELVVAGTAGDHVGFFGEIEFEQEPEHDGIVSELSVGHVDVRFTRLIKNSTAFNFKVGSWQPELVATFDHARRLTVANYDSMFGVGAIHPGGAKDVGGGGHHGGGGGIAMPSIARGIDMYGIAAHRFLWAAGLMNGVEPGHDSFDANSSKDYYGKIAYKFGGLAPDGSNAADYTAGSKNWREKSIQVGGFLYKGDASGAFLEFEEEDPMGAPILLFVENPDFERVGFDFNAFFGDVNIFGAYVDGEDELLVFEESLTDPGEPGLLDPGESGVFSYEAFFVEADVVLGTPWLHGAFRYESVDLPHLEGGVKVPDWERGTVHLTGLVRANVKTFLEYTWDLNESKNYNFWAGATIAY